jgi:uncharacterized protein
MRFEWDENKNNINILKHGIDFRDAKNAFEYPIIVKEDIRHEYGEKRFIAIGLLLPEYIIVIVYTTRDLVIRIISARLANKKEKHIYYDKFR